MTTDGSKIDLDSIFLMKHYFGDSKAYIALIDKVFIALGSW